MKYLINGFVGTGFTAMLIGMGSMDSASIIGPACIMFLGIGMMAFGGYLSQLYSIDNER